jgi:RNA polymerase sigma-70 factor (ECF subfamily)
MSRTLGDGSPARKARTARSLDARELADPTSRARAFERFATDTRPHAFGLAVRLVRTRSLAEDVVQQSLLDAWRHLDTFDPARGTELTWLLGIVRNRSIDALRRASTRERRHSYEEGAAERAVAPHDTVEVVIADSRAAAVRRLITTLPAAQREVIELAYFDGLTHVEIAARLGLPVGTVKGRTRLALARLRTGATPQLA